MDFYFLLTKLIMKENELYELHARKKIDQLDKPKFIKNFFEIFKSLVECKIESTEGRNFRIYFIEYLKDLIFECLSFFSEKEKKEFLNFIGTAYQNFNINFNNNYNTNNNGDKYINNDVKSLNYDNYRLPGNDYNIGNKCNNPNGQNKNNYYNNKINNNMFPSADMNISSLPNNKNIPLKKNRNYENNKKDYSKDRNENKYYYNNGQFNEQNKVNNYYKNDKFNNNIKNNNINNNYEIKDKNKDYLFKKNNNVDMNDNDNDNDNTYVSNNVNNKNYKNYYYNNINNYEKKNYKEKIFINKNQTPNNNNIIPNPSKFQLEIDNFYNKLYKFGITQLFIKLISDKKNNDLNQLCIKISNLIENSKKEYLEQYYKEELVTLICIIFPFAKGLKSTINDSIFKTDLKTDKNLFHFLKKNILMNNYNSIEFIPHKIEYFSKYFVKDLYLEPTIGGKSLVISVYIFLIIARCLRKYSKGEEKAFFDDLLRREFYISFKLHFIFEHQELYNAISDDFIELYNGLHFINVFYNEIFCKNNEKKRIMKNNNINKYVFGKQNFVLSLNKNCNFDIDILFSEDDNKIYKKTLNTIEYFYNIENFNYNDISNLIYYSTIKIGNKESNFIINIVKHICEKRKYIYKHFNNYKNCLINLEKKIFKLGQDSLNYNQSQIYQYSINENQKKVFYSLYNKLKNSIDPYFKDKFDLYPYGSITQFLGGKNSDIDIYLDIRQMKNIRDRINFLYNLEDTIKNITNQSPKIVISTRLCVISFKYLDNDEKETDFDISLMGFCPYIHSTLLRTYSLIDPRFSLLAISLKKFIEVIKIKSSENKIEFLNSFSWMILLITFLQDIINPPILPKLLSYKNNSNIYYTIQYGNNKERVKHYDYFVENIKEENTLLPDSLFNSKALYEIYHEQIVKNGPQNKNNLSCAEIFLYFLEFIIYYFKSDSVYVNCSIENEGYESMSNILNYNYVNDIHKKDDRFSEYFQNKYFKIRNCYDNKMTRDGLILIRDPLDPHYNPGQSLRIGNYITFIENLKKGYLSLLKHGDFDQIRIDND